MSSVDFTSKNIVQNGFNNTYEHYFVGSSVNFKDTEVAVHKVSIVNSVFNIDGSQYGNNTLTIKMPTAATTSNITITIQDGIYGYAELSSYIQAQLAAAGAYLIDADGNQRHYIQLSANFVYYACQVELLPVPNALPSGWSRPATGLYSLSGTGLPATSSTPILSITNAAFGDIIGFTTGDYPSTVSTTQQSFLSNESPMLLPVSNYRIRCNLVDNPYINPSDVICNFTSAGTNTSQFINYTPNEHLWLPVKDGAYPNIRLTIVDQLDRFVKIREPNVAITLVFRRKQA